MNAVARAREDLANDRAWKAHDRLQGLIGQQYDREIVSLLAEVHQTMRNYPAAGALWFVLGRDDDVAQHAIAAWYEKCPHDEARLNSLPKRIRVEAQGAHIDDLRAAAARWRDGVRPLAPAVREKTAGSRALGLGCAAVLLLLAIALVLGLGDLVHMVVH